VNTGIGVEEDLVNGLKEADLGILEFLLQGLLIPD